MTTTTNTLELPANPALAYHLPENRLASLDFQGLGATFKLDGIRVLVGIGKNLGHNYSRSLKPLPNPAVNNWITSVASDVPAELARYAGYLDCEIQFENSFQTTCSIVASLTAELPIKKLLYVFDAQPHSEYASASYDQRADWLELLAPVNGLLEALPYTMETLDGLLNYYRRALNAGFEGIVLRDLAAHYKNGRGTLLDRSMIAVVPTLTAEATLVGMISLKKTTAPSVVDERGYLKTSRKKEHLRETSQLGSMILRTPEGEIFKVGTGFSQVQRHHYWANQSYLVGQQVTYAYKELTEAGVPRHARFVGIRPAGF